MHTSLLRLNRIARRHPQIALSLYQRIEANAAAAGDLALQFDALYQRYFTLERIGQAASIEGELKAALNLAEENTLATQAGRLYEALGRIHYTRSEYRDALQLWTRCIDTSLLTGDIASGIEARIGLSQISNELGDPGQGARYFKDAEQLIDKIDNPYLASKLALNRGVNHFYFPNELDLAEQQFERGLYYATQGDIQEYIAEAHWHLAHVYLDQQQLDKGKASATQALALAEKSGYSWLRSVCYDTLSHILQQQGDHNAAYALSEKALAFAQQTDSLYNQRDHLERLSRLAEQQGDLQTALELARQQQAINQQMDLLSAPERLQSLRHYDLTQKPVSEQLLELAANPEINLGQHASLQLVLNEAAQILQLDWIGIWTLNPHASGYDCAVQYSKKVQLQFQINPQQTPHYFKYINQMEQLVIAPDARLHPAATEILQCYRDAMPQSILDFPLQIHNKHFGMVSFMQIAQPNPWRREDIMHCSHIVHLLERIFANKERDEIQLELQRNEKMASLGRLVAGIAHEINTPIGIGVTATSTLHSEIKLVLNDLDEGKLGKNRLTQFLQAARENVMVTERNLQRAAELIKSFKEIAVDQNSDVRRWINVNDYLNEILLNLSPSVKHTPYYWETQCPKELQVDTYPGSLAQIITNFINNSILHGFEGKSAGVMQIELSQNASGALVLDYRDDGCGMDENIQQHIFDPFFTTKLGQGGSGLGMNIVYNLITQRLKGSIEIHSQPNSGVHFHCVFPKLPD
ncbi:ATP-binding protein [Deefgea rivuli]|uniref:ATP-binding protein n=1 Tax=Deefgea rivuli TaxID=400948 RepID=UPI000686A93B|nr:ATP-binding protein [Deefgea rivuli]